MHHRHIWDVPEMDINEVQPETEKTIDEAYHQNKEAPLLLSTVQEDDNEATVLHRDDDVELETIDVDLVLAEDVIDDDEEEEEEEAEDETLFNYNNDVVEPEDIVLEEDDSDLEY
ncbi:acidic leucine-rich nuclear phosphoprotein 32 family member B-like [Papaver somniferum]|uniref:acidic leucine-rich nuclear phosphoprotein 32 family member B-like n=1 Tax=Papaver somniferum TaxID=3469 RepID=UPI000E6FC40F|nr:acidic leucine-rich nuclear phosphoprotein 32 family member B-like [Papaver somniferum]